MRKKIMLTVLLATALLGIAVFARKGRRTEDEVRPVVIDQATKQRIQRRYFRRTYQMHTHLATHAAQLVVSGINPVPFARMPLAGAELYEANTAAMFAIYELEDRQQLPGISGAAWYHYQNITLLQE
jgi:hypothetical protein